MARSSARTLEDPRSVSRCCCLLSLGLLLGILLLIGCALHQLLAWDEAALNPLVEPSLLEGYLGCDAVAPMVHAALEPLLAHSARVHQFTSSSIRRQQRKLRLARVQIVGSKLHITCPPPADGDSCLQHEARTLSLLLRITSLPDVDFLFDKGEGTCHHTLRRRFAAAPVVTTETADGCDNLLAPPRTLESLPDNARWLSHAMARPWEARRNVALFRGKATGGKALDSLGRAASMRAKAVNFSLGHPKLLDARFAGRGSLGALDAKQAAALNWSVADIMTWEEALAYRAQLVLDGNTLPDRMAFILSSATAVLKQDSHRREAFHRMMVPYVHYVPVRRDLSDLAAQLRWALSNSSRLHAIALNGATLAVRLLSRRAQLCHWVGLLRHMAQHTALPVVLDPLARRRTFRPPVIHEPLLSSSALRPQLSNAQTRLSDVISTVSKLHFAPCIGLTSTHLCLDVS